jgi:predicted amidohydrolase YtcJ
MRSSSLAGAALALIALLAARDAAAEAGAGTGADLVLLNGDIKTASGWARAMAVRRGVIVALGDVAAVAPLADAHARVVDLGGKTVLPGLTDSHVHPLYAGREQFECGFPPAASGPAIAAAVAACAGRTPPGEWILGGNWVAAAFRPGEQTKALLDAAAPANPVLLNDEAHHSVWVNSRALALAGIDRGTRNPPGGIIEHAPSGEPNGLLRESAARLAEHAVPRASEASRRRAIQLAANQMLSFGITAFTVASVRLDDIGPLSELADQGLLKQRVRGCIVWGPGPEDGNTMGETLIPRRADYGRARLKFDCVKIFLDGVPTESHTGAMLDAYVDAASGANADRPEKGLLLIPPDVLARAVTRFDAMGLSVKFHAAGDAAVREGLDAVAAARAANGFGGQVDTIAHGTFVDPADIPRARGLDVAWEFSPYIWYPTPIASVDILAAVGPERMKRWLPVREALATGALVVTGSDWSIVPSVNPWLAMETLVTRERPGGSAETLGFAERISLEDAFRLFTLNPARLTGDSDRVGQIAVGMHADVIVTDTNPFKVDIHAVHATKVERVFIDGDQVFDAAAPPPLTAAAMGAGG